MLTSFTNSDSGMSTARHDMCHNIVCSLVNGLAESLGTAYKEEEKSQNVTNLVSMAENKTCERTSSGPEFAGDALTVTSSSQTSVTEHFAPILGHAYHGFADCSQRPEQQNARHR